MDNQGYFVDGPFAGMAKQQDTTLIDSVLKLKLITDHLLKRLKFVWFVKPENEYYPLIPINAQENEFLRIMKNMIKNTSMEIGQNNDYFILITIKKDKLKDLKIISEDNLDRWLAILIDNQVYSLNKQINICENGELKIQGKYSRDEFKMIDCILHYNELPSIPIIDKIEYN